MTKTRAKKKTKAPPARRKAPNKPKHARRASAAEQVAERRVPATVEVETPPRVPFVFWPLEVMKWWMPSTSRS